MTRPFKPSMKFDPLITINIQKVVNKILIMLFINKLSTKSILVDTIPSSEKEIQVIIINIWKISLLIGELKILLSDKIPETNIQNKKNNSK